jgi:molybdenum cofactor biosynthesis protein MoaC
MGAKKTSELIPLCHNIDITNVDIKITTNKKLSNLVINASVKSTSKTGVEMEALTAVSISCLTIYDMCKSLDKNIIIDKIKLISKKGGKSDYLND